MVERISEWVIGYSYADERRVTRRRGVVCRSIAIFHIIWLWMNTILFVYRGGFNWIHLMALTNSGLGGGWQVIRTGNQRITFTFSYQICFIPFPTRMHSHNPSMFILIDIFRGSINSQKISDERHGPFKVHNHYHAEMRTKTNFRHRSAISAYAGLEAGNAGSYSALNYYQEGFAKRRDEIMTDIAKNGWDEMVDGEGGRGHEAWSK